MALLATPLPDREANQFQPVELAAVNWSSASASLLGGVLRSFVVIFTITLMTVLFALIPAAAIPGPSPPVRR
jgi:hypothetical protein